MTPQHEGRKSDAWEYENWPRWVRIAYCCTFPVSCPVLMLSMMLGTIAAGPVILVYLIAMRHAGLMAWGIWR